jgi:hypothetical protein
MGRVPSGGMKGLSLDALRVCPVIGVVAGDKLPLRHRKGRHARGIGTGVAGVGKDPDS